jgi:mono/diheme cytochrome c family protein
MAENMAMDYQEGPRLSSPQGSIPIQGEAVLGDEFPTNPIAPDDISLQRGQILYDVHCALCHGMQGLGDGPLAKHFERISPDLAGSTAANEFDGSVYLVILQGFGQMPSLSENLTVRERWDVINYVRTITDSIGVK